jgi:hypothetical protein
MVSVAQARPQERDVALGEEQVDAAGVASLGHVDVAGADALAGVPRGHRRRPPARVSRRRRRCRPATDGVGLPLAPRDQDGGVEALVDEGVAERRGVLRSGATCFGVVGRSRLRRLAAAPRTRMSPVAGAGRGVRRRLLWSVTRWPICHRIQAVGRPPPEPRRDRFRTARDGPTASSRVATPRRRGGGGGPWRGRSCVERRFGDRGAEGKRSRTDRRVSRLTARRVRARLRDRVPTVSTPTCPG